VPSSPSPVRSFGTRLVSKMGLPPLSLPQLFLWFPFFGLSRALPAGSFAAACVSRALACLSPCLVGPALASKSHPNHPSPPLNLRLPTVVCEKPPLAFLFTSRLSAHVASASPFQSSFVYKAKTNALSTQSFLAGAAAISIPTARPALTKRDDVTTIYDDIALLDPKPLLFCCRDTLQLFFQAGFRQFVFLPVLQPAATSIAYPPSSSLPHDCNDVTTSFLKTPSIVCSVQIHLAAFARALKLSVAPARLGTSSVSLPTYHSPPPPSHPSAPPPPPLRTPRSCPYHTIRYPSHRAS